MVTICQLLIKATLMLMSNLNVPIYAIRMLLYESPSLSLSHFPCLCSILSVSYLLSSAFQITINNYIIHIIICCSFAILVSFVGFEPLQLQQSFYSYQGLVHPIVTSIFTNYWAIIYEFLGLLPQKCPAFCYLNFVNFYLHQQSSLYWLIHLKYLLCLKINNFSNVWSFTMLVYFFCTHDTAGVIIFFSVLILSSTPCFYWKIMVYLIQTHQSSLLSAYSHQKLLFLLVRNHSNQHLIIFSFLPVIFYHYFALAQPYDTRKSLCIYLQFNLSHQYIIEVFSFTILQFTQYECKMRQSWQNINGFKKRFSETQIEDCSFIVHQEQLENSYHLLLHTVQYVESLPYLLWTIFQAPLHCTYQDRALLFTGKLFIEILLVRHSFQFLALFFKLIVLLILLIAAQGPLQFLPSAFCCTQLPYDRNRPDMDCLCQEMKIKACFARFLLVLFQIQTHFLQHGSLFSIPFFLSPLEGQQHRSSLIVDYYIQIIITHE